jgi:hypothetical protein
MMSHLLRAVAGLADGLALYLQSVWQVWIPRQPLLIPQSFLSVSVARFPLTLSSCIRYQQLHWLWPL